MIGKVYKKEGGGTSEVINGIIEQYKANTSTIDANSFVEFVNSQNFGSDTTLSTQLGVFSATTIDENTIFVTHKNSTTGSSPVTDGLFGIICTISGTTITAGTDTQLVGGSYTGTYTNVVTLETNKIFIIYCDGSNQRIQGVICTISGSTITVGSNVSIYSANSSMQGASITKVDANKVFISMPSASSNYYLMGIVCTVSGSTITVGSATTLKSTKQTGYPTSSISIDTNKVFILHPYDTTNKYLSGLVCTISGTTITAGTDTQLSTISGSGGLKGEVTPERLAKLDTNKIFAIYTGTNSQLNGIVCTVSGSTITKGVETVLDNNNSTAYYQICIESLDENTVYISHQDNSAFKLVGMICTVSGTAIIAGTNSILSNLSDSGYYISTTALTNKVFVVHRSDSANKYLNGIVVDLTPTIKESVLKIDGITKEEISTSTAGDVWVLNQE